MSDGRVITVYSSKGGVGKTVLSVNLAIALAKFTNEKVALIDLDMTFCDDISLMLGVNPEKSFIEMIDVIDSLDPRFLKGFVTSHDSGIDFIPATLDDNKKSRITKEVITKILNVIRQAYSYIVIDSSINLNSKLISILDNSNMVLALTLPNIVAFKHLKSFIARLVEDYKFPPQLFKYILNNAGIVSGLEGKQISEALNVELLAELPFEETEITGSINKQTPIFILNQRSPYSKEIKTLAQKIAKGNEAQAGEGGLFTELSSVIKENRKEIQDDDEITLSQEEKDEIAKAHDNQRKFSEEEQEWIDIKLRIHDRLVNELDLRNMDFAVQGNPEKMAKLRKQAQSAIEKLVAEEAESITDREKRAELIQEILDEALGLGPIEKLLRDPTISEIMVISKDETYIERSGKVVLSDVRFLSDDQLLSYCDRIVAPIGRRIDESSPYVDARLKDGSRVHIIIPPLALKGPTITIRKFSEDKLTIKDLVRFGSMTEQMATFIEACVLARKNIVVSGGTGSGKTTLLNIISNFVPDDERIITIEDSAELQLQQDHVVRLETRPPNIEGGGEVTIRDLVKCSLRMRPERIIVGECRGGETLDMLQAMNTGHDGSMTTGHANSPREMISRLETMVLMSGMELPVKAIREQIAGAVDIIIQVARLADGSRRTMNICEVTGMEGQIITLQDIFIFKQTGVDENFKIQGFHTATGVMPTFLKEFAAKGIHVDPAIFTPQEDFDF